MKKVLLLLLILATLATSQQNDQDPKVAISFNAVNFVVYTLDIDGYIKLSENNFVSPGIGFGTTPFAYASYSTSYYNFVGYVPHQVTFNLGFTEKHHFLELGYKGLLTFVTSASYQNERSYGSYFLTGYRHHGKKSHLLFKTYVAPGIQFYQGTRSFALIIGVALGGFF